MSNSTPSPALGKRQALWNLLFNVAARDLDYSIKTLPDDKKTVLLFINEAVQKGDATWIVDIAATHRGPTRT